jgi:hypothetical protein
MTGNGREGSSPSTECGAGETAVFSWLPNSTGVGTDSTSVSESLSKIAHHDVRSAPKSTVSLDSRISHALLIKAPYRQRLGLPSPKSGGSHILGLGEWMLITAEYAARPGRQPSGTEG